MPELIFVVDDNDANLAFAASALEDHYRVLTMPSAEKMFFLLEKKRIPALIFLDIEMPGMNGMEALRGLKANPDWQGIPVLFLTGHGDEALPEKASELGAAGVVRKPIAGDILLEQAARLIAHGEERV